jgi:hypothetical protein
MTQIEIGQEAAAEYKAGKFEPNLRMFKPKK